MDPSPLTRQTRPDSFQPKIVQLYNDLFAVREHVPLSEGFWRELFLLPPDRARLRRVLDSLTTDDILLIQEQTRSFFTRAIEEVRSGVPPRNQNALENLTAFLGGILSKKYTNPSSDVIATLAGLERVDRSVSDLVNGIDDLVRNGSHVQLRSKAIETALALTAGAYQTGLISYLTHRDLFPALMKFVKDSKDSSYCFQPLLLLGLLANYNKFEFQNPYQNRLEDFVNEQTIQDLVRSIGQACNTARDSYLAVHDDMPDGWNMNSALLYIGLGTLTPEAKRKKAPPSEEEAKELFDTLPSVEASICLPTYSFVYANKLFASNLASLPSQNSKETPLSLFLSFTSYLSHHAYRSQRCLHYTLLNMLTIQTLVEDPILIKRLSSDELKTSVRLCRQRPPSPPLITSVRTPASGILDICTDTISHNLRRRLDIPLHQLALGIILRIISHLSRNKVRLSHHWSYLWGTLLSFLRFLTHYTTDLNPLPSIHHEICNPLTELIAFCLSTGDSFLSDPASYDDLFYKLIEMGSPLLTKFRDAYYPPIRNPTATTTPTSRPIIPPPSPSALHSPPQDGSAINILIQVSTHYHSLLQAEHGAKKTHQSPAAVQKVIKQGYETLSIEAAEGLGRWERWREGGGGSGVGGGGVGGLAGGSVGWDWRGELKRIVRTVVADAKVVAGR